jgi:hypothetical protein
MPVSKTGACWGALREMDKMFLCRIVAKLVFAHFKPANGDWFSTGLSPE